MNTYRFCDEATSEEVSAATLPDAVTTYLAHYDTAEMTADEMFPVRVYDGEELLDLLAVVTVSADGEGGVESWEVRELRGGAK